MEQPHKDNFARALGPMVVKMMDDVMAVPDELRPGATASTTIVTVDGHEWTISVDWGGFNGPNMLPPADERHDGQYEADEARRARMAHDDLWEA